MNTAASQEVWDYPQWLNNAVVYQIYPQSFKDSDGDGIGDLKGIMSKLTYVKSLGVNAIWLNPCFESTFFDAGYDVVDYYKIAPRYGTNKDMENLISNAHNKDLKVILDLVAGHTSIEHKWFKSSSAADTGKYADRYIWTDSRSKQPTWFELGEYARDGAFLKNFFATQPALNYGYANPDPDHPWEQSTDAPGPTAMREELKSIIAFWMDKGADGFRVDMASSLVKNDEGFVETFKLWGNIRSWFSAKYPEGVLIAEWSEPAYAIKSGFMVDFMMHFGVKGYKSMFFEKENVVLTYDGIPFFSKTGKGNALEFITNFTDQQKEIEGKGLIALPTSNHDFQRLRSGTRQTEEELKVALVFFLTWKAIPFIYYGDEIGMKYIETRLPDIEGSVFPSNFFGGRYANRAGSRTPMQWTRGENAGFSDGKSEELYLPIDPNPKRPNVEKQENNKRSMLNFTRSLINLKQENPALRADAEVEVIYAEKNKYPLVYKRKSGDNELLICVNPSGESVSLKIPFPDKQQLKEKYESGTSVNTAGKGQVALNMKGTSYAIYSIESN